MTTGLISKGGDGTPALFWRQWSGTNGRTATGVTEKWNPYSLTLKIMSAVGSNGPIYKNQYLQNIYGYYNDPGWTANDELKVLSKLSTEIRGHSFNLNVAAAEGKQTITLVLGTLKKLTQAMREIRAGRPDRALRALGTATPRDLKKFKVKVLNPKQLKEKDISALWLEIQYGWMPLYKDVYEAMSAYAVIANEPRTTTVKARANKTLRQEFDYGGSSHHKQRALYKRQIVVELKELMSVPRALGLTDPLSVAWELQPLSFVADWFIPIGSYLELLSMIPQLEGRWCTTTTIKTETKTTPVSSGFWSGFFQGAKASNIRIDMNRTLPLAVPVPSPEFKPLNKALNLPHVLNGIALLHQVADVTEHIDLTRWKFR